MPAKIVGISACTAGIAHTYMAAEALVKAGKQRGDRIFIETQGALGAQDVLTPVMIEEADVVIIAADVAVDMSRFQNKMIYQAKTLDAIKDSDALIEAALQMLACATKDQKKETKPSVMHHVLSGVSYMGLLCVVAGMLFALASFGARQGGNGWSFDTSRDLGFLLHKLYEAAIASFQLAIPLFAGFVAKSIGDKPAMAPAMIAAYMANQPSYIGYDIGGGFLSALMIALFAGYSVKLLKAVSWPSLIAPIMGFFIIPLCMTLVVLCIVIFVGRPVAICVQQIYTTLSWMQQHLPIVSLVFGILLGGMMGFDFGGPINKLAMIIAIAVFADTINAYGIAQANFLPQSATQAALSIAPISIWLASKLTRRPWQPQEKANARIAFRKGIMGISEGAIPFVKGKHSRVVLASVCGSGVAGGLVSLCGCKFYGGIGSILGSFIGYVAQPIPYITWIACILVGIIVSTGILLKSTAW